MKTKKSFLKPINLLIPGLMLVSAHAVWTGTGGVPIPSGDGGWYWEATLDDETAYTSASYSGTTFRLLGMESKGEFLAGGWTSTDPYQEIASYAAGTSGGWWDGDYKTGTSRIWDLNDNTCAYAQVTAD